MIFYLTVTNLLPEITLAIVRSNALRGYDRVVYAAAVLFFTLSRALL
jgi:hypothetical protein